MASSRLCILIVLVGMLHVAHGRKHHLQLEGDARKYFEISDFGFYQGGFLAVNVTDFHFDSPADLGSDTSNQSLVRPSTSDLLLGFSIDKTSNSAMDPFEESSESRCVLSSQPKLTTASSDNAILKFSLNFTSGRVKVECSKNIKSIDIFPSREILNTVLERDAAGGGLSDSSIFRPAMPVEPRSKREERSNSTSSHENSCKNVNIQLDKRNNTEGIVFYNTSFFLYISDENLEGLYSLYFHNCFNYHAPRKSRVKVGFTIDIEEKNRNSYLSAGEIPLPALYLLMSVLFFLSGCFWVFILRKSGAEQVYRIHWIMTALVYMKSLSLFFHGINYHKIETNGYHIETWAVLYYITHLLKGGLLFFTIVLIGSGWAFIKHVLSDNEKKVFMFVLPLQVIANVAYIIVEESEEGDSNHNSWQELFILVDLLCCGAILLPVVWSIRHLQEAAQTDGKASISLEKLKLFRHFYLMVVCYIYFTRIIVYLIRMTVPFQYEWLDEMFKEMATFVFFVMTGYKFRPASNNPYFNVPTEDYEEEILIGNTAINEQVTNRKKRMLLGNDADSDDDEEMVFFSEDGDARTERNNDWR